jgi:hypothetical protein
MQRSVLFVCVVPAGPVLAECVVWCGVVWCGGVPVAAKPVLQFFQKASQAELQSAGAVRPDGTVLIDTGVSRVVLPCQCAMIMRLVGDCR